MNEKAIKRVYEHLFENKYLLDNGIKQFDPDFLYGSKLVKIEKREKY